MVINITSNDLSYESKAKLLKKELNKKMMMLVKKYPRILGESSMIA